MEQDKELKAINDILSALENLDEVAKARVVDYVLQRLNLKRDVPAIKRQDTASNSQRQQVSGPKISDQTSVRNIRTLKDQKQPSTAIQMAVLVAFYLKEYAQENERKEAIGVAEIETYFNQAGFALPRVPLSALSNAKAAGYLESAELGMYKLNPVGYNLAAYGLPEKNKKTIKTKRASKSKPASKKKKKKR